MPRRILIIRRDNIGDLILTTPLITALRRTMPDAYIAALVTSYNAPVLEGNPALNALHIYTKGKHASGFFNMLHARIKQALLFIALRRESFDDIVLAEMGYLPRNIRLAKFIRGAKKTTRIVGFEHANGQSVGLDVVISKANTDELQQAQYIFLLARAYGIDTTPLNVPPCVVYPSHTARPKPLAEKTRVGTHIGIHISARKPSQQWSAESFVALIQLLNNESRIGLDATKSAVHPEGSKGMCEESPSNPQGERRLSDQHFDINDITLFWSPGAIDDPLHPGDDAKAATILNALKPLAINITPCPTATLRDLINALALVDMVVCADGGALHVAAGLGKPVVALFGDSEVKRWHPWGVDYRALQKPSLTVADIAPQEVFAALIEINENLSK
jgi:heptosyltransferase III